MEFNQLVKTHSEQIKKIISLKVKNTIDHDDIYQEVLIKLWKNIAEFKGESKYSTWVHCITENTIIDYFRVNNNKELFVNIEDLNPKNLPIPLKNLDTPEYQLERKIIEESVTQLKMNSRRQLIFDLYQQGKNKKEIAQELNIPIGTVSSNLVRIKKGIRKYATTTTRRENIR
ncbi:MAG: sigma-70 family RNA polymerase sigma factor [Proteobacteria bacterium]|nr:sigma-70 family RNA polymerase sigma factor [Pseudomonadota bacterium]